MHKINYRKNQQGITLLLTIMLVATLTLISTTVAYLGIQQIRNSRAAALSNPALGAAESGGEEGIWNVVRKNIGAQPCDTVSSPPITTNLSTNTASSYTVTHTGATLSVRNGTPKVIYLYDPSDANGDTDLHDCPYDYIDITFLSEISNGSVNMQVERLDGTLLGTNSVDKNTPNYRLSSLTGAFGAGIDNRMKVTFTYDNPGGTTDIFVTTGDSSNVDFGLPSFPVVDSVGCSAVATIANCTGANETFSRRLNITIPVNQ
jgi:hypothetical protein